MTADIPTVTYCTPEDVADTMDLPDPNDPNGRDLFSDVSHPSYRQVCRMIVSNENQIDMRTHRSWKENQVKDMLLSINDYWHDINGWRSDYYAEGGAYIQLRRNVRIWDPSKGDKLEIRTRMNQWADISQYINGGDIDSEPTELKDSWSFWFDYPYGKLYLKLRLYQQRYNAARITYRYGSEEPVPAAINRLCCLMTASQIMNMQAFNVRVGNGGDISGIKDSIIKSWQEEAGAIFSSYQRAGIVRGTLR